MSPDVSTALTTRGLTKRYKDRTVVDDLDLRVPEGGVFGFLGRNGAGKTTTIRMVLGLARPTGGSVRILGRDTGGALTPGLVGYLPDVPGFRPWMRADEVLAHAGRMMGLRGAGRGGGRAPHPPRAGRRGGGPPRAAPPRPACGAGGAGGGGAAAPPSWSWRACGAWTSRSAPTPGACVSASAWPGHS